MDRVKFENLVDQAIRQLPAEFRKKLENVVVLVEDRPSEEFLEDMEIPGAIHYSAYMKARRSRSAAALLATLIASGFFKIRSKRSAKARKRSRRKSRQPSSTRLLTFSVSTTNISRTWATEGQERVSSIPATTIFNG